MSLFSSNKTKKNERVVKPAKVKEKLPRVNLSGNDAIIRPHITEKSGIQSQNGVYTFQVTKNANKDQVAKAIKSLYKVMPVRIGIVNVAIKNVFVRGKRGTVPGMKKALVTLKKGDKIDFA